MMEEQVGGVEKKQMWGYRWGGIKPLDKIIEAGERIARARSKEEQLLEIKDKWSDRLWRLESGQFYKIKDKNGNVVPYIPNENQKGLHRKQWYRNIIVKARQLGFSTDIEIQGLDYCLFNSNVTVWVIAHDLKSARDIFKDKVKFAYDNLPDIMKQMVSVSTDNTNELSFSNGSRIQVGTSFRSGTLQFLHISEFGKICLKYPERVREIVEGAIEAVPQTGYVFIESTAEQWEGAFYDYAMEAYRQKDEKLTKQDYRLHFYPWWKDMEYRTMEEVTITTEMKDYFNMLEIRHQITLDEAQKRFYVLKRKALWGGIYKEYPSFFEEAFKVVLEGVYYEKEMMQVIEQHRICKVPYDASLPCYTAWDLGGAGGGDETAIWFYQRYGKEVRLIDYWEWSGHSLQDIVYIWIKPKWYKIQTNFLPHDAKVVELGTGKSRVEVLEELWLDCEVIPLMPISDWIQAVRATLPTCWFDEERTSQWIRCLNAYRREWDDKRGGFKDRPFHDWSSHGCFIWETMIETIDWPKNIVDVKIWDYVLTRKWYRKVIDWGMTWIKDIWDLGWLLWTAGHNIITWKWKKHLASISKIDTLSYLTDNEVYQWRQNIDEKYINYTNERDISANQTDYNYFIELYGQIIGEKFQNDTISTIKMRILWIMMYLILSVLRWGNIYRIMVKKWGKEGNLSSKNILIGHKKQQSFDIEEKKGKNGTSNIMKTWKISSMLKKIRYVLTVAKSICQSGIMKIRSVAITVSQPIVEKWSTTLSKLYVNCVKKYLLTINIIADQNFVASNVEAKPTGKKEKVYNITVEWEHEYYANGILVANSDAMRYLCTSIQDEIKTDIKPVSAKRL